MSQELRKRLSQRAAMLQRARQFFTSRSLVEVDCSALVRRAPIDSNIDVISAAVSDTETGFLHTSPEYAMKRLLAGGSGDIYFLSHVFRKGESGRLHNPEFTMAEWYRLGFSYSEMIQETCAFLFLFFGPLPIRILSYRDAFAVYANVDYRGGDLKAAAQAHGLRSEASDWSRQAYLHYLLTHAVEPCLGENELTVLSDFPPNEAALARVAQKEGETVAERFEIYYKGVELANGYHELADAAVLRERFEEENRLRQAEGKESYLLDEAFLAAMRKGLPPCCGVSVGFDRALMLQLKAPSIHDAIPLSWSSAATLEQSGHCAPC